MKYKRLRVCPKDGKEYKIDKDGRCSKCGSLTHYNYSKAWNMKKKTKKQRICNCSKLLASNGQVTHAMWCYYWFGEVEVKI